MQDQIITQSPTPSAAETLMDFPSAMAAVINGARITKKEWSNTDCALLRNGWLMINRDGTWHRWVVSDGDMLGQDWVVL